MSKKMQPIDPAERSKIAKLQNEIKSQSSDRKVEWLYSGDKIDRDAYLLGKPIDKLLVEKELEKPKEQDIFSNTIDLANKIRDDPLFEIKKREIEAKKRLLENPLKLKQLKQMISKSSDHRTSSDSDSEKERKKDKRRHKKSKKHRKKSKQSSDEERDSSDDDRKHKAKRRSRSRSRSRDRHRNRSRERDYGLVKSHEDQRRNDRDESREKEKSKSHREVEDYKKRIEKLKNIRKNTDSNYKPYQGSRNVTTKLSEEEKQRRLREMEENAKWRSDVRSKNIDKYKQDERKEKELQERDQSSKMQAEAANLFNNIMKEAYVSTEDRIKRNMFNVQRNKSSFDSNFVRK